ERWVRRHDHDVHLLTHESLERHVDVGRRAYFSGDEVNGHRLSGAFGAPAQHDGSNVIDVKQYARPFRSRDQLETEFELFAEQARVVRKYTGNILVRASNARC